MKSKLVPANPSEVMVIRSVTPNITTLSVPFLRFGRIRIGGRGTVGEYRIYISSSYNGYAADRVKFALVLARWLSSHQWLLPQR
jgi:hypothetical protein